MKAERKEYYISGALFQHLNVNSDVELHKSCITGSLQKVSIRTIDQASACDAGFVRARMGRITVPLIILGCLAMLIFFKTIDNIQGRANLTYALLIGSFLLWYAHLDLRLLD